MKKIKKKLFQSITVWWIDACDQSGWKSVEDALKTPNEVHVITRAFYLGQDKNFLCIADSIGKSINNDVGGIWHIPLKCIKKTK